MGGRRPCWSRGGQVRRGGAVCSGGGTALGRAQPVARTVGAQRETRPQADLEGDRDATAPRTARTEAAVDGLAAPRARRIGPSSVQQDGARRRRGSPPAQL